MQDTDETLAILQRLRDHGIRLAMDDFGTGYSSLGYLQKFRFDKIKIDRSFVSRLGQDPNADAIVRAVVGMSEALGVRTIAEGVETSSQASELRAHGCPEAQGYLYSRPIDGDAFAAPGGRGRISGAPAPATGAAAPSPCSPALLTRLKVPGGGIHAHPPGGIITDLIPRRPQA